MCRPNYDRLFEAWFFAMLQHKGVTLTCVDATNRRVEWPRSDCKFVDLCDDVAGMVLRGATQWLIPRAAMPGGFDAVLVDTKTLTVKFLQFPSTIGAFDAAVYSSFLVRLHTCMHWRTPYSVELYVVIPLCWKGTCRLPVDGAGFQLDVLDVAFAQLEGFDSSNASGDAADGALGKRLRSGKARSLRKTRRRGGTRKSTNASAGSVGYVGVVSVAYDGFYHSQ